MIFISFNDPIWMEYPSTITFKIVKPQYELQFVTYSGAMRWN